MSLSKIFSLLAERRAKTLNPASGILNGLVDAACQESVLVLETKYGLRVNLLEGKTFKISSFLPSYEPGKHAYQELPVYP
jgi:hypothetical protein